MKNFLKLNKRVSLAYFLLQYKDYRLATLFNKNKVGIRALAQVARAGM